MIAIDAFDGQRSVRFCKRFPDAESTESLVMENIFAPHTGQSPSESQASTTHSASPNDGHPTPLNERIRSYRMGICSSIVVDV